MLDDMAVGCQGPRKCDGLTSPPHNPGYLVILSANPQVLCLTMASFLWAFQGIQTATDEYIPALQQP